MYTVQIYLVLLSGYHRGICTVGAIYLYCNTSYTNMCNLPNPQVQLRPGSQYDTGTISITSVVRVAEKMHMYVPSQNAILSVQNLTTLLVGSWKTVALLEYKSILFQPHDMCNATLVPTSIIVS